MNVRSSRIFKMKQFWEEILCGKSDIFKKYRDYIKFGETKKTYRKTKTGDIDWKNSFCMLKSIWIICLTTLYYVPKINNSAKVSILGVKSLLPFSAS